MFKWLGNFVDSQDKELSRLRKIVSAVNAEIEELLTAQLEALAALRDGLERTAAPAERRRPRPARPAPGPPPAIRRRASRR